VVSPANWRSLAAILTDGTSSAGLAGSSRPIRCVCWSWSAFIKKLTE